MARPKKTETKELLQLVDSYFTTEAAGDPSKLKCSLLEAFAVRNGKEAKAYDFRRDPIVRGRMEELKALVQNENGVQMLQGNSYKSLDVDRIMKTRRDPDGLRSVLGEMDDYWRGIYENSMKTAKKNTEFRKESARLKNALETANKEMEGYQSGASALRTDNKALVVENRYLRKMLKTYLYPALANEILQQENLLKNEDTEVTERAGKTLIDGTFPSDFKEAVSEDIKVISKEESLLEKMWEEMDGMEP